MVRTWSRFLLMGGVLAAAAPASAQVVQSLHIGVGGFLPRGFDARGTNDVLRRNFVGDALPADPSVTDALAFEFRDFRSTNVFAEWNVSFGPHVEVGAGLGVHRKSVPTVYRDLVDPDFNEITQQIRLRVAPITAVVRFLPVGDHGSVQPYLGFGVSAMRFRYTEIGSFVDPVTLDIFENFNTPYVATGTAIGTVLLGGVRLPLGGDIYALSLEYRYATGSGNTGGFDKGFVADKVDLSGGEFNVGMLVRF